MRSTEEQLRLTVAALLFATGETQRELGAGIGRGQTEISRRQSGATPWTLADLDALAAHYGIPVPDLLCGVDHALSKLPAHRRAATLGGTRATITTPEETR
ncbi:acyltransferase [Streptomyces alkaliphilus]|nr:acyltransferase [Streptomyces alkaliphilus]MQS06066.1 acyltransferase [Streptomyces alkaliphilus]